MFNDNLHFFNKGSELKQAVERLSTTSPTLLISQLTFIKINKVSTKTNTAPYPIEAHNILLYKTNFLNT